MSSEDSLTFDELHRLFEVIDGKLIRKCHVATTARKGMEAGGFDKTIGYYRVKIKGKSYLTHRLIYMMEYGSLPDLVDHVDGDTGNNLPENLREASKANNRWNCNGNEGSQSGVKGVYNDRGRWKALITFEGQRYYLGMYGSLDKAGEVVRLKYEELQGEFSKSLSSGEKN